MSNETNHPIKVEKGPWDRPYGDVGDKFQYPPHTTPTLHWTDAFNNKLFTTMMAWLESEGIKKDKTHAVMVGEGVVQVIRTNTDPNEPEVRYRSEGRDSEFVIRYMGPPMEVATYEVKTMPPQALLDLCRCETI